MKANHNSDAINKETIKAGYELSKIQNESESQHTLLSIKTASCWL